MTENPGANVQKFFIVLVVALLLGAAGLLIARFTGRQGPLPRPGAFPAEWHLAPGSPGQQRLDELLGQPVPRLDLADWVGPEVPRQSLAGKIVVLDFWATWCKPCLAAIPHNNELVAQYAGRGVLLIGVAAHTDPVATIARIAKDQDVRYPIARDASGATAQAWGISFYPTYAVIDRRGLVRAVGLQPEYVASAIEKLLAEDAAASSSAPATHPGG